MKEQKQSMKCYNNYEWHEEQRNKIEKGKKKKE
jgi:hypothetical protein